MFDFVTIDFETANEQRSSPCELGITVVKDDKIKETKSWLIKPHKQHFFSPWCIRIHGIKQDDVRDASEFPEVWAQALPLLNNNPIFAHNAASVEVNIIKQTSELYGQSIPELEYFCSMQLAKKICYSGICKKKPFKCNLESLCQCCGIPIENHHCAGADSLATAQLLLNLFKKQKMELRDLKCLCQVVPLKESTLKKTIRLDEIVSLPETTLADGFILDFAGRNFCCTGEFSYMTRDEAHQKIEERGGIAGRSVTKRTDFLVVGCQNRRIVGESGKSSKQRKAEELQQTGHSIIILSEEDFLKYVK